MQKMILLANEALLHYTAMTAAMENGGGDWIGQVDDAMDAMKERYASIESGDLIVLLWIHDDETVPSHIHRETGIADEYDDDLQAWSIRHVSSEVATLNDIRHDDT